MYSNLSGNREQPLSGMKQYRGSEKKISSSKDMKEEQSSPGAEQSVYVFVELPSTVRTTYHSDWKRLNHCTQTVSLADFSWRGKHAAYIVPVSSDNCVHIRRFDSQNDPDSRKAFLCNTSLLRPSIRSWALQTHRFRHLTIRSRWAMGTDLLCLDVAI